MRTARTLPPFRVRQRVFHGLALLTVALLAVAMLAASAEAQQQTQVKAKDLIGYAVEQVGPKHEDVDLAIQKFVQQDIEGARALLDQAKRKDPNLPPADLTLAKLFMLANQGPAARQTLEKYTQSFPEDPEPLLIFGEQAVADGKVTDSQLLFEKAMKLTDAYTENPFRKKNYVIRSHAGLATVAEMRKRWSDAIKELQAWIAADLKNVVAHQRIGRTKFMLGQDKEAYVALMEALKHDPEMVHPDMIIAKLYDGKGDRNSAEKFVDRALNNKKANLPTRLAAVRWLVESDQLSRAKPELDNVIKDHPDAVDAHLFAGIVGRMMSDEESAQAHLEKAYLLAPQNFDTGNQLALYLISQPDEDKRNRAVKYAENNARIFQQNSEAGVTLGWIYYQMGQTRQAEQLLNQALRGGRLSADSSYFVAKIFWDRGKNDTAAKLLEQALDSKRVFVHRNEARALLQKIKPQAAKAPTTEPASTEKPKSN